MIFIKIKVWFWYGSNPSPTGSNEDTLRTLTEDLLNVLTPMLYAVALLNIDPVIHHYYNQMSRKVLKCITLTFEN